MKKYLVIFLTLLFIPFAFATSHEGQLNLSDIDDWERLNYKGFKDERGRIILFKVTVKHPNPEIGVIQTFTAASRDPDIHGTILPYRYLKGDKLFGFLFHEGGYYKKMPFIDKMIVKIKQELLKYKNALRHRDGSNV